MTGDEFFVFGFQLLVAGCQGGELGGQAVALVRGGEQAFVELLNVELEQLLFLQRGFVFFLLFGHYSLRGNSESKKSC